MDSVLCLGSKENLKVPKRGDVWLAKVEDVAMPPSGTRSSQISAVNEKLEGYMKDCKTRMLKDPIEIRNLREDHKMLEQEPYVDPELEKNIVQLGIAMAKGGMLVGIDKLEMTVGLFTVVKKVENGRIHLRLVLDQRMPNMYWQDPPWVGLGGPELLLQWKFHRTRIGIPGW